MHKILFLIVLGCGILGCNAQKPAEQAPAENAPQQVEKAPLKVHKLSDDELKRRNEVVERMRKEGRIIPPLTNLRLSVLDATNISDDDVQRSFLFRESAFDLCYLNAIAYSGKEFAGKAIFRLKRNAGSKTPEVSELSTDLPKEMEECLVNSMDRWPVSEGSEFKVQIDFTATARTIEDIKKQLPADEPHDHHHNILGLPTTHNEAPDEAPDEAHDEAPIPALPEAE